MVKFLNHKDEAFKVFYKFLKHIQNGSGLLVVAIISDHGDEFEIKYFWDHCENFGKHYFSTLRITQQKWCCWEEEITQQNSVVDRKNLALQEMAQIILNYNSTPNLFWEKIVNTTCYLQNRIYIRPFLKRILYGLWKDTKPTISYFNPFEIKCLILNTKDHLEKFNFLKDEKWKKKAFPFYILHL